MSVKHNVENQTKKFKKFFGLLGPGLTTGAADDDPSGIATYSQTGAQFGYGQLWTALYAPVYDCRTGSLCKNRNGYR